MLLCIYYCACMLLCMYVIVHVCYCACMLLCMYVIVHVCKLQTEICGAYTGSGRKT
jgi:hypothetical protein